MTTFVRVGGSPVETGAASDGDGLSLAILGELDEVGDLPVSPTAGESYLIAGHLWSWSGTEWLDLGSIQGPQGPPADSIGVFSSLAGTPPTVASTVTQVRTPGYSTAGKGSALYYYDATVDSAYVTANPRTSFLAADGRGFRLSLERVTPFMFGALGGATDDNVALQAFFDFVSATEVGVADVGGEFSSSVGLVFGRLTVPLTLMFTGRFGLTMTGTGTHAFTIKDWVAGEWDYLRVLGTGSTNTFSTRTWVTGLFLDNTSRCTFRFVHNSRFAFAGIAACNNNNTLNHFGMVKTTDCGSGARSGADPTATKYGLTATWSNPVNSGSSGSVTQQTVMNVDVQPPSYLTSGEFGALGDSAYMIRLTNTDGTKRVYWIKAADPNAGTITVFPWVDANAVPGVVDYVFGGGLYTRGNDSNIMSFDMIDATRCGIGLAATSLYGPTGRRVVTQFCGIAIALGRAPSGAILGTKIDGAYFESNRENIIYICRPGESTYNSIDSEYALDLSKCYTIGSPRVTDNSISTTWLGFERFRLSYKGRSYSLEKRPYGGDYGSSTGALINRPDQQIPLTGNSVSITLSLDLDIHRMMGYDTARVIIVGSGTGGAPTGTITFPVPASDVNPGFTVNGGSSAVTFTGFTGPAEFICRFDVLGLNLVVTKLHP